MHGAAEYASQVNSQLLAEREYMENLKLQWKIPYWEGPYCRCPDWGLGTCAGLLVYEL
jgi:hypothetical protein